MYSVAIIGADGAGKSTVIRALMEQLPHPVKTIYMGIRFESSDVNLPTTKIVMALERARLVRLEKQQTPPKRNPVGQQLYRVTSRLRPIFLLLTLFAEEWYRQMKAWRYMRQGYIVIFDRHFMADNYAFYKPEPGEKAALGTRVHQFMLDHFYPEPDMVLYLRAPASVLFARKGEGPIERLEKLVQCYDELSGHFRNFVQLDATQSREQVAAAAVSAVEQFGQQEYAGTRIQSPSAGD